MKFTPSQNRQLNEWQAERSEQIHAWCLRNKYRDEEQIRKIVTTDNKIMTAIIKAGEKHPELLFPHAPTHGLPQNQLASYIDETWHQLEQRFDYTALEVAELINRGYDINTELPVTHAIEASVEATLKAHSLSASEMSPVATYPAVPAAYPAAPAASPSHTPPAHSPPAALPPSPLAAAPMVGPSSAEQVKVSFNRGGYSSSIQFNINRETSPKLFEFMSDRADIFGSPVEGNILNPPKEGVVFQLLVSSGSHQVLDQRNLQPIVLNNELQNFFNAVGLYQTGQHGLHIPDIVVNHEALIEIADNAAIPTSLVPPDELPAPMVAPDPKIPAPPPTAPDAPVAAPAAPTPPDSLLKPVSSSTEEKESMSLKGEVQIDNPSGRRVIIRIHLPPPQQPMLIEDIKVSGKQFGTFIAPNGQIGVSTVGNPMLAAIMEQIIEQASEGSKDEDSYYFRAQHGDKFAVDLSQIIEGLKHPEEEKTDVHTVSR